MVLLIILVVLLMVSFLFALWSLKGLRSKKEIQMAKEDLSKNRVVFQNDSSSSEAS